MCRLTRCSRQLTEDRGVADADRELVLDQPLDAGTGLAPAACGQQHRPAVQIEAPPCHRLQPRGAEHADQGRRGQVDRMTMPGGVPLAVLEDGRH